MAGASRAETRVRCGVDFVRVIGNMALRSRRLGGSRECSPSKAVTPPIAVVLLRLGDCASHSRTRQVFAEVVRSGRQLAQRVLRAVPASPVGDAGPNRSAWRSTTLGERGPIASATSAHGESEVCGAARAETRLSLRTGITSVVPWLVVSGSGHEPRQQWRPARCRFVPRAATWWTGETAISFVAI